MMERYFLQDQICHRSFTVFFISIIRLHMKADPFDQNLPTPKQLKPLNSFRHRSLQHREDIYRFMRAMQSEERGALDEIIKVGHKIPKGEFFFLRGKGNSWKRSLGDSRQVSRCIIHAENEKAIEDSLAQRQAEKALIIKNLSVSCSTSKQQLNETPFKLSPSQYRPEKKLKSIGQKVQSSGKSKVSRVEGRKHMFALGKIIERQRIKTEGDVTLQLDNRKHLKKSLLFTPQQNNLQSLDRMQIVLNKSLPLNHFQNGNEDRGDNRLTAINRLGNQSDYLTIKKLKYEINCKPLHQSDNSKMEKSRLQDLDSPIFRKYSQIGHLL